MKRKPACQDVVGVLEQLLVLARAGEVRAFMGAAIMANGDLVAGVNVARDVQPEDLRLANEMLRRQIAQRSRRAGRDPHPRPELVM